MASEIERGEERGERDREREERGKRERAESGRDELYLYKRGHIQKTYCICIKKQLYIQNECHIYKMNCIFVYVYV